MIGALVLVFVLVVVIPVTVLMSGAVVALILGRFLKDNAEAKNEGSELIDLNT